MILAFEFHATPFWVTFACASAGQIVAHLFFYIRRLRRENKSLKRPSIPKREVTITYVDGSCEYEIEAPGSLILCVNYTDSTKTWMKDSGSLYENSVKIPMAGHPEWPQAGVSDEDFEEYRKTLEQTVGGKP